MSPVPQPMPWVKLSELYYCPLQVRMWGPDTLSDPQPWTGLYVRVNVSDPYPDPALLPNTVYTVDLTPLGVAEDAKVAFLSGILIITHGSASETGDVRVTMAAHGDPLDVSKYIGQTVEAQVGGGQRSNMATWVPLNAGKFDFSFQANTTGVWPANCGYGINLTLQAWGR